MLQINRIREYIVEVKNLLFDDANQPLFGFVTTVVDDTHLSRMLKERVESENSFLIAVVPDFVLKGHDDAVEYSNALTFFILDKIDYSEKDNDAYIDVFARTQIKVHRFIEQLLKDKSNYSASYCNFLRQLNIQSVRVVPYWEHNDCNGWQIDFNVLTH